MADLGGFHDDITGHGMKKTAAVASAAEASASVFFTPILARIAKKLALAGALVCAGGTTTQAQTNVTIYGRVDAGINYQSNVDTGRLDGGGNKIRGSKWSLDGNEWGTSMLGFKASEDLSGGTLLFFTLESGFDASTGSVNGSAGLWTRRSYIGLSGAAGTLKIGKDLALQSDPVWALDPTGQQALSTATLVKGRNWLQTNNMISYASPNVGGLTVTGMHGFGEQAGSFKLSSSDGVALAYAQPLYELRAIYDVQRDANGGYSTLYQSSKELILGGAITLNKLKLFAGFENLRAPNAVGADPDRANMVWLGANYQIAAPLTLIAAVYHTHVNKNVGSVNLFMLGGNVNLSKRTLLYATIGAVRNSANSDFSVEYGSGGIAGQNQNAFYAGISHTF
jgi:predicted porin